MLSIDYIRENKQKVLDALKNKKREADIEGILTLDEERRKKIQEAQILREERNKLARQPFTEETKKRGKEIKDLLKTIEGDLAAAEEKLNVLLSYVVSVPLDEVPIGLDETGNKELRKVGEVPTFSFPIKDHTQLGVDLDIIDFERGTKVSGYRGYFLKNQGAILHLSLIHI